MSRKNHVYSKETIISSKTKLSYSLTYCRLTVIDATKKITESDVNSIFLAFQNGLLDSYLEVLKKRYKRIEIQKTDEGNIVTVKFTKRSLLKK